MTTAPPHPPEDRFVPHVPARRAARATRTQELLALARVVDEPAERAALLDTVVVLNRGVADAVAHRYRGRGVPWEDLRQAASEGLVKAVRRYDADQSEDLLTFAVPTIRGEVQRHFRDRSWMVRPPRRVQELQRRVADAAADLAVARGQQPTLAELCDHLGVTRGDLAEVEAAYGCFRPASLDRPAGDGADAATMGDLIPDAQQHHVDDHVERRCLVEAAVRGLDRRERRLVYLRFYEERSQREIGNDLGLTQTQVSRLLERVLGRMRASIEVGAHPRGRVCGSVHPSTVAS